MATLLAGDPARASEKSTVQYGAAALLAAYLLAAAGLLALAGGGGFPAAHLALDSATVALGIVLAGLLWTMGRHMARPLAVWLAIALGITTLLDLYHLLSGIDAGAAGSQSAAEWAASAYGLALSVAAALWLQARGKGGTLGYGLLATALAGASILLAASLPILVTTALLGISAPALAPAPLVWLLIAIHCWRRRGDDRLLGALGWMAAALLLATGAMLFSRGSGDAAAIVAHLGRLVACLILFLLLLALASGEFSERARAERRLAQAIEERERQVRARTADLEAEVAVRRDAEESVRAQLQRLSLLQQVTRATSDRQSLHSIYGVALRSLEDQLAIDCSALCLHDGGNVLTVARVGPRSAALAGRLGLEERSHVAIEGDDLAQCVHGRLVYAPDLGAASSAFGRRMAGAGLSSLVLAPLQADGGVFGILMVARRAAQAFSSGECEFLRQVAEQVALAAHQAQLYEALQQAYDDLQQTQHAVLQQERLRALGQMASGIGHDINNALSPIALHTEALLESEADLSPRVRESLLTIQRATGNIVQTVARMREFYRPRAAESAHLPVAVNPVILQAIDLTRARWHAMPQKGGQVITVKTDLAAELPAVTGIVAEIREALVNLILNAVDAMPRGGTLTLRSKAVPRTHGAGAGHVQIDVADTGIGMTDETRRRCMEPFFTTKGEHGSGLGLASVYGVVRRHGAEIDIRSVVGRGTTVSLVFPVPATDDTTAAAAGPSPTPERLRLLLVDDDPLFLTSLGDVLEADGHIVTETSGGQAAIDAFRAAQQRREPFSAVITDLGMPYVDGRRVAGAVKELAPATPVILLTGWGQRLLADDDFPPNVDRVLNKPPKLRELRQTLGELCRPQEARPA